MPNSIYIYWDSNLYRSAPLSIHLWVLMGEIVIVRVFKWQVGVHFGQIVAKNNDFIKNSFKHKLLGIKFPIRNSVDA